MKGKNTDSTKCQHFSRKALLNWYVSLQFWSDLVATALGCLEAVLLDSLHFMEVSFNIPLSTSETAQTLAHYTLITWGRPLCAPRSPVETARATVVMAMDTFVDIRFNYTSRALSYVYQECKDILSNSAKFSASFRSIPLAVLRSCLKKPNISNILLHSWFLYDVHVSLLLPPQFVLS